SPVLWVNTCKATLSQLFTHSIHVFFSLPRPLLRGSCTLILEEIAIDCHNKELENMLLHEAQELHLSSLALAIRAFGVVNVQTAKHYGNLGRLYQSMQRYKEAEEMHLKAIDIKEKLLGQEDYEVALSVGHLASLYNYDMNRYDQAEQLYLRSISIGRKLFGDGYSGLEYDYRGLIKLYNSIGNIDKVLEYHEILNSWNQLRDRAVPIKDALQDVELSERSTEHVIQQFLDSSSSSAWTLQLPHRDVRSTRYPVRLHRDHYKTSSEDLPGTCRRPTNEGARGRLQGSVKATFNCDHGRPQRSSVGPVVSQTVPGRAQNGTQHDCPEPCPEVLSIIVIGGTRHGLGQGHRVSRTVLSPRARFGTRFGTRHGLGHNRATSPTGTGAIGTKPLQSPLGHLRGFSPRENRSLHIPACGQRRPHNRTYVPTMVRAYFPTLYCAVLLAVTAVSLGSVPPKKLTEDPNRALVHEEKGPTLANFADEGDGPLSDTGPRQEVLGGSPYYAPWVPSDGTAASHRLATHPLPMILLGDVLRGKRGGGAQWRRGGREVRVYDRATRRWYRYFIPSLSMNNVFGQFRPAGTIRRMGRELRGGASVHTDDYQPEADADYGQGLDIHREGGSRAWPEEDYGYY
ncbi:Amyloid protein-binding protein 2, partial [Branchiostoma belcheri]